MHQQNITIGYLTVKLDNSYQGLLWQGISNAVKNKNIKLIALPGCSINSPINFDTYLNIVYDLVPKIHLDGLIASSGSLGCYCGMKILDDYLNEISGNLPIVTIATKIGRHPSITCDIKTGLRDAIRHLAIDHGCKRFAHISGPPENPESIERTEVLKQILQELKIPLNPELIENGKFIYTEGKAASFKILDKNIPFDAMFASNDETAVGFIDACKERGIKVPYDIRVVGIDNTLNGRGNSPSLSSVDAQVVEQGKSAVDALINIINNKCQDDIVIPSSFIKRESCGCILSEFKPDSSITIHKKTSYFQQLYGTAFKVFLNHPGYSILNVDKECIVSLVNKLVSLLNKTKEIQSNEFKVIIDDFFKHFSNTESAIHLLQKIIVSFQEIMFTKLKKTKNLGQFQCVHRIYLLLDDIRLYCNIKGENYFAEKFLTLEKCSIELQYFNQYILSSQTLAQLYRTILQGLPVLNITDFFILLFSEKPVKSKLHYEIDVLKRGIIISDGVINNITAPVDSLNSILEKPDIPGWIIMSLTFKDEQLGFIGIGLRKNTDLISERLSIIISGMLKSIQIFEEKNNAEKQLKEVVEKLAQLSIVDELTGLYNRRGFLKNAELLIPSAIRTGDDIIVIYADLDNLKIINDTYGHAEGDKVIYESANVFKKTFRQIDVLGRMGGDEFAIICKIKNFNEIETVDNRLMQNISDFNNNQCRLWKLSITVGFCTMCQTGLKTISQLLEYADNLLYEKKRLKKLIQNKI